jgi:hypothetical protein
MIDFDGAHIVSEQEAAIVRSTLVSAIIPVSAQVCFTVLVCVAFIGNTHVESQ